MNTSTIAQEARMDAKTLDRIATLETDIEQINDQIKAVNEAEKVALASRIGHSNRIGALEWEKWFIQKNIARLKNGLPEMEWPTVANVMGYDDDEYQPDEVSTH